MKTCPGWRSEGDEGREHMLDKVPLAHSCCVFSGRSETRATQARKERDTSWKDLEEPHGKGAHRCGSFCAHPSFAGSGRDFSRKRKAKGSCHPVFPNTRDRSLSHTQTQACRVKLGILTSLLPHCISEAMVLGLEGSPLLRHHRTILLVFLYLSNSAGQ